MSRLIEFIKTLSFWQFVTLFVVIAIALSEMLIIGQSYWLHGEIHRDLLIIGFITPAIVAFILSYIAAVLLMQMKQAERSLSESQQRLVLAGKAAYDLIYEWDVATDRVVWFDDVDRLLGYESGAIPQNIKAWLAQVHPEDREQLELGVEKHRFSAEPIDYQYRVKCQDGSYRYWIDNGLPLLDKNQRPYKWIGVCTDVTERRLAEKALREREALLQTVLNEMPDVVTLKDYKGNFLLCNQTVADLYNTTPEAMVGKHDGDFGVPEEMANFFRENVLSIMEKGETEVVYEDSRDVVSGETRHFKSIKKPFKDVEGRNQILVIAQDVTDIIRAQEKVAESEATLRNILDNVDAYIYQKDMDGNYLFANRAVRDLWDASIEEIIGYGDEKFFDAPTTENIRANDRLVLSGGEVIRTEEIGAVPETGMTVTFQTTKLPLRRENGEIYALCGISVDITRQKEHQKQLEYIAHYDGLTHLPNRVLLADRLQQAMAQTLRREKRLAVVYLDIDGFKPVNDKHGHQAGDELLKTLAGRMKQALREGDTIARLGGDEFVAVLIDYPDDKEEGELLLKRLLAAVAQPVHVKELILRISASLGVTFYPQADEQDADQLLRQSDQAMYLAKLAGKNCYHFFDSERDRYTRGRHKSLERIHQALTDKEFLLYYQPKVNMRSGEVVGAEALIRWQHPEQGLLLPNLFLPTIEDHPLAVELGEWVVESALAQMEAWQEQGLVMPVSVNVGTTQLEQPDFVQRLKDSLEGYPDIQSGSLELEILETSALEDVAEVSRIMRACHEIGVTFALDDFGTGYSSLTYLKRLPAVHLKIDRSFIRDMLDDPDDLSILEGVIGLAAAFHLQTIAEGVETEEHGKTLLQLGCELAQGFGIARPMPAKELPTWVDSWKPPQSWIEQQPVSREALPILSAAAEHRAWVRALENYLMGERNEPPVLDHEQCRFGQWLYNNIEDSTSTSSPYQKIEILHRQVHVLGQKLCDMTAHDQKDEVANGLNEMHKLRDALLAQLQGLLSGT